MLKQDVPDPAYLRERLRYDPETGKLWWRTHPAMPNNWNVRYAGTEAFTALDNSGYLRGSVDKRLFLAHRIIWVIVYGEWPSCQIDHDNRRTTDNRIGNLVAADNVTNHRNTRLRSDNTSGVAGVYWREDVSRWDAQIGVEGRNIHLGLFDAFDAAAEARKAAEIRYGFHPNHGQTAPMRKRTTPPAAGRWSGGCCNS